MFNVLADLCIAAGIACVNRADGLQKRRDRWIGRGRFWSDAGRWLRLRCTKSFADVRSEREKASG